MVKCEYCADDTACAWEETTGNPVICLQGEKYCSSDNKNEIEAYGPVKEEGTDCFFP